MTKEKALLQDELKRVKYRIQILKMIEDKLREMKSLAEQVAKNELSQREIAGIQCRVNQLISEIDMLEKINEPEILN